MEEKKKPKFMCRKTMGECKYCMIGLIKELKDCPNLIIRQDDKEGDKCTS